MGAAADMVGAPTDSMPPTPIRSQISMAAVAEVQRLKCSATAGTFALQFRDHASANIALDAAAARARANARTSLPCGRVGAVSVGLFRRARVARVLRRARAGRRRRE